MLITAEAREIEKYIIEQWGRHVLTELEVPLRSLFPQPENKGLLHIWTYGSADVVIRRRDNGKLIAIIEPGGAQHVQDEKQIKNDGRKFKLCQLNSVGCLCLMNSVRQGLSGRRWRRLIGGIIFGAAR